MMSYAKRSDFTFDPDQIYKPGPGQFETHELNTISKNSLDKSSKQYETTFRNNYDKYKGICYKGME